MKKYIISLQIEMHVIGQIHQLQMKAWETIWEVSILKNKNKKMARKQIWAWWGLVLVGVKGFGVFVDTVTNCGMHGLNYGKFSVLHILKHEEATVSQVTWCSTRVSALQQPRDHMLSLRANFGGFQIRTPRLRLRTHDSLLFSPSYEKVK